MGFEITLDRKTTCGAIAGKGKIKNAKLKMQKEQIARPIFFTFYFLLFTLTKPTLTVGAFLALHLLLAYWSPWCVWGADLLTFYPAWAHLLFASLSALLLIPRSRSWALDWLSRIPDLWECTHRSRAV